MKLEQVRGENFRLFSGFAFEPAPRLNWITGANAAGKTTLLEAIYALGRARSFRGTAPGEWAGAAGPHWRLAGRIAPAGAPPDTLRIEWSDQGTVIRAATGELPVAELVQRLPVQVLEPGAHRLLEEGPGWRRRYLDWGVFHVEPSFYPTWRRYQRALRQRNQALRQGAAEGVITAWDPELAEAGESLDALRQQHLEPLRQRAAPLAQHLLGEPTELALELARGWNAQTGLRESLARHLERDRRAGQTLQGPHRAELRVALGGQAVRNRISRGQQKLLVAALLLAQAALIREACGRAPLLLVDDLPAELGPAYRQALLAALKESGSQVFVTAVEAGDLAPERGPDRLFHVEQGAVRAI